MIAEEVSGGAHGIKVGGAYVGKWNRDNAHEIWSFSHGSHWPSSFILTNASAPPALATNGSYRIKSGILTQIVGTPPSQAGRVYHLTSTNGLDAYLIISYQPGNWSQPEKMYWYSQTTNGMIPAGAGWLIDLTVDVSFGALPGLDVSTLQSCYFFNEQF